jgi:hypothetical protein
MIPAPWLMMHRPYELLPLLYRLPMFLYLSQNLPRCPNLRQCQHPQL